MDSPAVVSFEAEWSRCRPWLMKALARGGEPQTHDIDDVLAEVLTGDAQFWPGLNAAFVTQVHDFPRYRALHSWIAGGDLGEIVEDMLPEIEAWGRGRGCTRFTVIGRKGWLRVLAKYGYRPCWHACGKDD